MWPLPRGGFKTPSKFLPNGGYMDQLLKFDIFCMKIQNLELKFKSLFAQLNPIRNLTKFMIHL